MKESSYTEYTASCLACLLLRQLSLVCLRGQGIPHLEVAQGQCSEFRTT